MSDGAEVGNSLVSFSTESDGSTVQVRDEVGTHEYTLRSADPVSLEPASADRFVAPVDAAVSFSTTELELPADTSAFVRDGRGEHLGQLTDDRWEFDHGTHYVELSPTMKTYVLVPDAAFTGHYPGISEFGTAPRLEFDEPTRLFVGTRSPHERPETTITVPDDPEALLTAFSALGSSLKEYSCERSWPTLRGHPPAIERGDELHVPDVLSKPDTGVTIAVPPTYPDLYRVAPLVYYLGADVVPGEEAELRLDTGYTEPLRRPGRSLEEAVDRLLARCLLLDSLVRVGGYYSLARYEYDEIAPHLPFYPPNLYDASIPEQLMEYLEVTFDALEPHVPRWELTATLRPTADDASLLSPVLDRLGRVHVAASETADEPREEQPSGADQLPSVVTGYTVDPTPANGLSLSSAGFEHGRDRTRRSVEDARLRFVGGGRATRRAFDALAPDVFRTTDGGDVTTTEPPTRAELRRHLAAEVDFLHVGPATERGFPCEDGYLPFDAVEDVGATTVSVTGRAAETAITGLVDAGAVSGVAAADADSADVGRLAGFLVAGHTLPTAADVAGLDAPRFAGDATRLLVHRNADTPRGVADVSAVGRGEYRTTLANDPSLVQQLGSVVRLTREFARDAYQLAGTGVDQPLTLSRERVVDLLDDHAVTVRLEGEVYYGETDPDEFVRRATRRALDTDPR